MHPSDLPERFGLATLIVLGEAIASVATATNDTHWQLASTLAAVGGFAIAACLWWLFVKILLESREALKHMLGKQFGFFI